MPRNQIIGGNGDCWDANHWPSGVKSGVGVSPRWSDGIPPGNNGASACEPTIETSVVIDDSELLCHEQLVALDNFLDHFAFRIEPEIG